jgi:hypothetical protein
MDIGILVSGEGVSAIIGSQKTIHELSKKY